MKKHNAMTARKTLSTLMMSAVLSLAMSPVAAALEPGDVTLQFANGQDTISGTLTDYKDGKFFMQASIGLVVIPTDGVTCVGDPCPESTRPAVSTLVVLTSKDGSVSLSGQLVDVTADEYLIVTAVGDQRISRALVNCAGESCPAGSHSADQDMFVELTNGQMKLSGDLLEYDGDTFFVNDRLLGNIRVNARGVDCVGAGCPK
ncbi:hypothetical protein [Jannaschia pohangensis]|uniref:Uncharacterized protein n=1 Tax=Jannaschia pohangensis TaxID=390807 RepID=A0A1I3ISQ8_9RHOB|nr:hypothetical protein [Jannaschia pohangensis]SFI51004.1 hypothetical protein SAMN04488095_1085 [Jannaschia pohangensis]